MAFENPLSLADVEARLTTVEQQAGDAQATADAALTSANGKNVITHSTGTPSGDGVTVGDMWFRRDASNVIIGQWRWSGSAWVAQTLGNEVIANLDAGKITVGILQGITLIGNLMKTATTNKRLELSDGGLGGALRFFTSTNIERHRLFHSDLGPLRLESLNDTSGVVSRIEIGTGNIEIENTGAGGVTIRSTGTGTNIFLVPSASGRVQVTGSLEVTGTFTNSKFPIKTADITDLNVTSAKLANKNVTGAKIADNTIGALQIAANSIGNSELATDAVQNINVANAAIGSAEIANDAIGSQHLATTALDGHIRRGQTVVVISGAATWYSVAVSFGFTFATIPNVQVTYEPGGTPPDTVVSVAVSGVTTTGCTLWARRETGTANLNVSWLAVE